MTTKEMIFKKIKMMPESLLQELLGCIDLLLEKRTSPKNGKESARASSKKTSTRKSLYGLWAGHGKDITRENIDEARKEMWGNFPRDDF